MIRTFSLFSKINTQIPSYFLWIDAMRGLAALTVVVFHYHHFYLETALSRQADVPPINDFPYASVLWPIYTYGHWAVQLFWIISGFVFTHVYIDRVIQGWTFLVARIARLYPLHLVTLIYMAALQSLSLSYAGHWQIYVNNNVRHFVLQTVMMTNISNQSRGLSFNGPIWSVSAEMGAYAAFFISLFFLKRAPVLLPFGLCIAGFWIGGSNFDIPLLQLGLFTCLGYFFAGAALYGTYRLLKGRTVYVIGLAISLTAAALASHIWWSEQAVLVFAGCAIISILATLETVLPSIARRLRSLGDISYSLYLVHVPIQATVLFFADIALDGSRAFADSWWLLPTFAGISVVIAHFTYKWFERPAGRFVRTRLRKS